MFRFLTLFAFVAIASHSSSFAQVNIQISKDTIVMYPGEYYQLQAPLEVNGESVPMAVETSSSNDVLLEVDQPVIFSPYEEPIIIDISVSSQAQPGYYSQYVLVENTIVYDSVGFVIRVKEGHCDQWTVQENNIDFVLRRTVVGKTGELYSYYWRDNEDEGVLYKYVNESWSTYQTAPFEDNRYLVDNNDNTIAIGEQVVSWFNGSSWDFYSNENIETYTYLGVDKNNHLRYIFDDTLWNLNTGNSLDLENDYASGFYWHNGPHLDNEGNVWTVSRNNNNEFKLNKFNGDQLAYSDVITIFNTYNEEDQYWIRRAYSGENGSMWFFIHNDNIDSETEGYYVMNYDPEKEEKFIWKVTSVQNEINYWYYQSNTLLSSNIVSGINFDIEQYSIISDFQVKILDVNGKVFLMILEEFETMKLAVYDGNRWNTLQNKSYLDFSRSTIFNSPDGEVYVLTESIEDVSEIGTIEKYDCYDCHDDLLGFAEVDQCEVCAGGETGLVPNETCADCAGVPNGTAEYDDCQVCSGGTTGIEPNAQCVTSVDDAESTSSITAFPNPSHGVFNLNMKVSWEVYDMVGQLVLKGDSDVINISDAPSGLYLLKTADSIHKIKKD